MTGCPNSCNIPEPTPKYSQEDFLEIVRRLNKEPLTEFIVGLMTSFKVRIEYISHSIDERYITVDIGVVQPSIMFEFEKDLFKKIIRYTEDRRTTNYKIEKL